IARIKRFGGGYILGAIEIAQPRTTPPVQDVEQQAVITALWFHRPEDAPIRRKMHPATDVSRCQLQVGDELIGGMRGINGKRDRPVELLVRTYLPKGFFLGKGSSRRYQDFSDCHRTPPWDHDSYPCTVLRAPWLSPYRPGRPYGEAVPTVA